ncbi:MAG: efflux RND transporter periplasmic adaptor subunit [Planctomycetota bacterium]
MIDLSKLRTPAWQRVVAELSAPAPDDRIFMMRLLAVVAQAAGAKQSVLWAVPVGGDDAESATPARAMLVWPGANPEGPPTPPADGQLEHEHHARQAATAAGKRGKMEVFGLEGDSLLYDGGQSSKGYLVAAPLGAGGADNPAGVRHVLGLVLDGRSKQAMQTTLALIEVLCGYTHGHSARQALKRTQVAAQALDLATTLIGSINTAKNFKGATIQLSNDLSRQLAADRVSIGWTKGIGRKGEGDKIKVTAVSDTEHLDRRMEAVQKIEKAMDECLDQEQPVVFPSPPERPTVDGEEGDVLLAQAVTHAHRELTAGDAQAKVVSVPLRADEDVVGVITVEVSGGQTLPLASIELLQSAADLIAPVLRIRRSDDRNVALRSWDASLAGASWFVGPKHTVWKLVGIAVIALAFFVAFFEMEYRIEAPVRLEAETRRFVAAPFDGVIASVPDGIEEDAQVEAGQVLAMLDTTEYKLQRIDAIARREEAAKETDRALAERDIAALKRAEQRVAQAQAEIDLYDELIRRAEIRAPIGGRILSGDLSDRIGASVALGDGLYEIAPLDSIKMIARVGDRDISLVSNESVGDMATKARPGDRFPFEVIKIVPLATPEEGENAFEVHGRLLEGRAWMRPGMEGLAKFNTGERTLADIGTRRIRDTLRLWLWF